MTAISSISTPALSGAQTAELQKIGVNINQIARRINSTGLCTRRTWRTSRGRWHRYGSYKDPSYQVNAEKALDYIENPDKTDQKLFVSSYGCSYETADIEFQMLLDQAYQKGNNLAHHLIQAFEPGETTAEQAHEIGRQLADEVLQGKYPM